LTIEREESKPKGIEVQFHCIDLVPAISSWLSFDWFVLPVETLRDQVIRSLTDVAESSISLLARGFEFERGKLRMFKRRRVCMGRRMKMIGFF